VTSLQTFKCATFHRRNTFLGIRIGGETMNMPFAGYFDYPFLLVYEMHNMQS